MTALLWIAGGLVLGFASWYFVFRDDSPHFEFSVLCRVYYHNMSERNAKIVAVELARAKATVWPQYQRIYDTNKPANLERIVLDSRWSDPKHGAGIKMTWCSEPVVTLNPDHGPWGDGYDHRHAFAAELHNLVRLIRGLPYGEAKDADDLARIEAAMAVWRNL